MANPFDKFKTGYNLTLPKANSAGCDSPNQKVFNAAATTSKVENSQSSAVAPTKVVFPSHLYIPEGSQSLDFRKVMNLPTGITDYELFRFVAPPGAVTRFISYGIFNDGDDAANYEFRPLLDGNRIFGYHGDPSNNFKIALGLGPDLSQSAMIPCQLYIQPGQVLQWLVTNTSGVDTSMGVRMSGYFDTSQQRVTGRFGG